MLERKISKAQIAKEIGVDRSTVHREIKRNRNQNSRVYDPGLAHEKYKRRMHEKPKRTRFTDEMKQIAREKLEKEQWSPDAAGSKASPW